MPDNQFGFEFENKVANGFVPLLLSPQSKLNLTTFISKPYW